MRIVATIALALPLLALTGCYTVNQGQLGNFVTSTVQPGMTLDEALVRMRAEHFDCQSSSAGTLTVCTRSQRSLLRGECIERVDLVRSAVSTRTVGGVDILEIKCSRSPLFD